MKTRHWIALCLAVGLVAGCASVSQEQALEMTKQLIKEQVSDHLQSEQWVWRTDWETSLEIPLEETPDRIPEWAQSDYVSCFTWDAPFTWRESNSARQRGEPQYYDHEEEAWGVVMFDKHYNVHVLEIGYTYEESDQIVVDGWEEEPEDDS